MLFGDAAVATCTLYVPVSVPINNDSDGAAGDLMQNFKRQHDLRTTEKRDNHVLVNRDRSGLSLAKNFCSKINFMIACQLSKYIRYTRYNTIPTGEVQLYFLMMFR